MNEAQHVFYALSVALAIGLLIGVERGWNERMVEEGKRVAGVRTHGLVGLLGGASALLAGHVGHLFIGLAFVGLAIPVATSYVVHLRRDDDMGITSLIALLLTFVYGALAVMGEVSAAAASAVVTTLLLSAKPTLHRWLRAVDAADLRAGIKLLLISVVILPILPNQGYGPWKAINPYAIWWMVVLIAAISFAGYLAVKIAGQRRGIILTSLFGGLTSSTVVTLHFSRMARAGEAPAPLLSMGILLACGIMLPRMLLLATVVNPELARLMLTPVGVMAVCIFLPALVYWRSGTPEEAARAAPLKNPLELGTALAFGLLLALVMLFGKGLNQWFGTAGVLALAAASGISDVDAITLSLAQWSGQDLTLPIALIGILLAASANSLTKGAMAAVIGGHAIRLRVGLPLLGSAIAGLASARLLTA